MRTAVLAALAGIASASFAQSDTLQGMPADRVGHLYYNISTGELIRSGPGTLRNNSNPVWLNEGNDQCNFAEWYSIQSRNTSTGLNDWWLDWGDVQSNSVVDCMTFLYTTTVHDAAENGVPEYRLNVSFFDGVDRDEVEAGLDPFVSYAIEGIPGSESGLSAWLITVDLSGGNEFEIGDADGIDDSGIGNFSDGLGVDLDGDGLSDFAYGLSFTHPAELLTGASGFGLGGPSSTSPGEVDAIALFQHHNWTDFDGFVDFGGYDCSGGSGYQWTPWASTYLGLYGPTALSCAYCDADLNHDCDLDFFDIQKYLNWFASGDPRAHMNNDGVLDFFDVQEYLGLFSNGCP